MIFVWMRESAVTLCKKMQRSILQNVLVYFEQTADSDTVLAYQVSLVQLLTDKKLEALNKA